MGGAKKKKKSEKNVALDSPVFVYQPSAAKLPAPTVACYLPLASPHMVIAFYSSKADVGRGLPLLSRAFGVRLAMPLAVNNSTAYHNPKRSPMQIRTTVATLPEPRWSEG